MASEATDTLRAAIIAALKRRGAIDDLDVTPSLTLLGSRTSTASVVLYGPDGVVIDVVARAGDDAKALRGVAFACGLREDGSDPVADVERLARALHDAARRLGCADYDDVCAATGDTHEGPASVDVLLAAVEGLRRERERLQRACDEGLPRERIDCPACGRAHVEGPRHDDPSVDGRTRPHHTHRCYHCGHVWDAGRWSFGVAEGEETAVAPSDVARLDDAARGALDDLAKVRAELDAARAALRQYAPRCECGALATRTVGYDDCEPSTLRRVCDREACGRGLPVSGESAHAAAVRAAMEGGR